MALKLFAQFISIVFHPLLVASYMFLMLLLVNPYMFDGNINVVFLGFFFSTFVIPLVGVLVMRGLGMISSLSMPEKEERIGPYIVTAVFYTWIFINLYNQESVHISLKIAILGATIGLYIAFIFNLFNKISLHALGMGGLLAFTILTISFFSYQSFYLSSNFLGHFNISTTLLLFVSIFLSGLVCTCRMVLGAHNLQDLYSGFIVGFSSQFVAMLILT